MKKNKVIVLFTIVLVFILISGSIKVNNSSLYPVKTSVQMHAGSVWFPQEKSKYLYVGAEKCASVCHNNDTMGYQLDIWKKTPHRNAYRILISGKAEEYAKAAHLKEDPQESQVCLKCHVTASGLDSTSLTSTYRKDDGVTCEACHKGEFISKAFIPEETDCLRCHNESVHKTDKFDFMKGCEKIAHQRPKTNF